MLTGTTLAEYMKPTTWEFATSATPGYSALSLCPVPSYMAAIAQCHQIVQFMVIRHGHLPFLLMMYD
jgi:hypothetical protein